MSDGDNRSDGLGGAGSGPIIKFSVAEVPDGFIRAGSTTRAARVLGDRWTILILRALFSGAERFSEIKAAVGGISDGVLSSRVKQMAADQLIVIDEVDSRQRLYRLSDRGKDTMSIGIAIWTWEHAWVPEVDDTAMIHEACAQETTPWLGCGACRLPVTRREFAVLPGPGEGFDERPAQRFRRKSTVSRDATPARFSISQEAIDVVGDWWSVMVLTSAFVDVTQFAQFERRLGIPTQVLSSRLATMVDHGIMRRVRYEDHPPRYEYLLTRKGEALYPVSAQLLNWGHRWLAGPEGPPTISIHTVCGQVAATQLFCSACAEPITGFDVTFQ